MRGDGVSQVRRRVAWLLPGLVATLALMPSGWLGSEALAKAPATQSRPKPIAVAAAHRPPLIAHPAGHKIA
jgi:hypothetical protein